MLAKQPFHALAQDVLGEVLRELASSAGQKRAAFLDQMRLHESAKEALQAAWKRRWLAASRTLRSLLPMASVRRWAWRT